MSEGEGVEHQEEEDKRSLESLSETPFYPTNGFWPMTDAICCYGLGQNESNTAETSTSADSKSIQFTLAHFFFLFCSLTHSHSLTHSLTIPSSTQAITLLFIHSLAHCTASDGGGEWQREHPEPRQEEGLPLGTHSLTHSLTHSPTHSPYLTLPLTNALVAPHAVSHMLHH